MATKTPFPWFETRFFTAEGLPAEGYKLEQYLAGTTTDQDTYTSRAGGTPNAHPIELDSEGSCTIFGTPGVLYDFVLLDPDDATVKTYEDITPSPAEVTGDFLELAGGTMEGELVLEADPTSGLQAATKQYVDSEIVESAATLTDLVDAATAAAAAATTAAAAIKQGVYIVASASSGSATLDIVNPAQGTYLVLLYTAASHPTPSATGWNITVTQAASFGATNVSTSFAMQKTASDTQSTYGSAIAVGSLTISAAGTFTLGLSAASLGGLTGRGSFLVACLQP